MSDALQRRGMNGVGLNEVLAEAQAPKGVLYHHFAGGKAELTVAAIEFTIARVLGRLDRLLQREGDPVSALLAWMDGAQKLLQDSAFERGCPLATVALESTPQDAAIRDALAAGFTALRQRIAEALVACGQSSAQAQGLAALIVAAYEGGLLQSRVAGNARPMRLAVQTLATLLRTLPNAPT